MWQFIKQLRRGPSGANALPEVLDLSRVRRVLVIAPHPDDETLGCGGTLARLAADCDIHVLLVTDGDGGGGLPPGTSEARKTEMENAVRTLGIANELICFDAPDGRFEDTPAFRGMLGALVERVKPDWVFLPWIGDTHTDHARISASATQLLKHTQVQSLLYYETWTPVPATHVVDITQTLDTKKAALLCHETALRYGNYLDAVMGLNAYRALYLPPGERKWAEAFAVTPPRPNRFD
ncbi:PIG-L deacetylase family protein [Caenimonas aquaedulcis]|uniref:PIG-L family deacetylase n=1 Tax=Caenimonas aquaedulcis TaxID=2793270 RepID=A0A931MIZ4_9BURK|nr:PIG-L deacetylase family protein [Caenimonas aquaedulcis]MBG9389780.1 PIG-L family deacetylase [Caenimonas aquaedulcis]